MLEGFDEILKLYEHTIFINRPFSLVDIVFPIQIVRRYPGDHFFLKLVFSSSHAVWFKPPQRLQKQITNYNEFAVLPSIPGYVFERAPTSIACGGASLFIEETLDYIILEATSNESFQALSIDIRFLKKKGVIYRILYRPHHSTENFLTEYIKEATERYVLQVRTYACWVIVIYVCKESKLVIIVMNSCLPHKVAILFRPLINQNLFTELQSVLLIIFLLIIRIRFLQIATLLLRLTTTFRSFVSWDRRNIESKKDKLRSVISRIFVLTRPCREIFFSSL